MGEGLGQVNPEAPVNKRQVKTTTIIGVEDIYALQRFYNTLFGNILTH